MGDAQKLVALALIGVLYVAVAEAEQPAARVAAPSFVVQGFTNIGGYSPTRDGSLDGARGVFGRPSSIRKEPYRMCTVKWADLGITMRTYLIAPSGSGCDPEGRHWSTRLTDERWRTALGLKIGDSTQKLMRLYPGTFRRPGGWWWLLQRDFLGTGDQQPMLRVRVTNGRVREFIVWYPAGGI
jgi:hypothetical protein